MYYLYGKLNRGHGICPLYGGCPLLGESVIRGFTVIGCDIDVIKLLFYFVGRIPLRHLVYRVHDLPPSMRPFVYDFGQLKPLTEYEYTLKVVANHVRNICIHDCVEKLKYYFLIMCI